MSMHCPLRDMPKWKGDTEMDENWKFFVVYFVITLIVGLAISIVWSLILATIIHGIFPW